MRQPWWPSTCRLNRHGCKSTWLRTAANVFTGSQTLTNATLVSTPEQAVAKGDAAAVAKKAADDARAAQEAQVDALFASDEEDEDYNPEAS